MFTILWEGERYIINMSKKNLLLFGLLVFFGVTFLLNIFTYKEKVYLKKEYKRVSDLNTELIQIEKKHDDLFNRIDIIKQEFEEKNAVLENLTTQHDELNNNISSLDGDIRAIDDKIIVINQKINKYSQ